MGAHERKTKQTPQQPEAAKPGGFYSKPDDQARDVLNPAVLHRERFTYLSRLHDALGMFEGVTSGITHVNTYPVLLVFRADRAADVRRVIVAYRDGRWRLSWHGGSTPAEHTAEAAHQLVRALNGPATPNGTLGT
ncbi:hypothetical protein [Actinomadura atramentaria]|uniref:hypothetical protein n=1 Tax=Actinomadura atramentaria TaxID=1990 RepID=UPI00036924D7|nr:hypothetical protein [Actinomadura atramentaria]